MYSEKLTAEERDVLRAEMLRERLRHLGRPEPKPKNADGTKLDKPGESEQS